MLEADRESGEHVRLLGREERGGRGIRSDVRELDEAQALLVGEQTTEVALVEQPAFEQHLAQALARADALLERVLELLLGQEAGAEDQRPERNTEVGDLLGAGSGRDRRGRRGRLRSRLLCHRGQRRQGRGHGRLQRLERGGRRERLKQLDRLELDRLGLLNGKGLDRSGLERLQRLERLRGRLGLQRLDLVEGLHRGERHEGLGLVCFLPERRVLLRGREARGLERGHLSLSLCVRGQFIGDARTPAGGDIGRLTVGGIAQKRKAATQ